MSQFHKICNQCRKNTNDQSFPPKKFSDIEAKNMPAKPTTSFRWYDLKENSGSDSDIISIESLATSSGNIAKEYFSSSSGNLQIKSFPTDNENVESSSNDDIPHQSFPSTTKSIATELFHSASGNNEEGIFLIPHGKSPDSSSGSGSGQISKNEWMSKTRVIGHGLEITSLWKVLCGFVFLDIPFKLQKNLTVSIVYLMTVQCVL